MHRRTFTRVIVGLVVVVLFSTLAVAAYGYWLTGTIQQRCLSAYPPPNSDETQVAVDAVPDYLHGRLTCKWMNESETKVSTRTFPLYQRS